MKTQNERSVCADFGPLISAMIDGELVDDEHELLRGHLEACLSCRQQLDAFEHVNNTIRILPAIPSTIASADPIKLPWTAKTADLKSSSTVIWKSKRLIPVALAGSLLLMFAITFFNGTKPATADQITPEQIVKPMTELRLINLQLQQDQRLMLRTLGMDLRLLKFEIAQLEPGSAERELFTDRLEEMLQKVQQFETGTY